MAEQLGLHVVVRDLDNALGPQRGEREILFPFQRERAAAVGMRAADWSRLSSSTSAGCAHAQGCPSNVVTSGCSSFNSSLRRAKENAPMTPTESSRPCIIGSPSSMAFVPRQSTLPVKAVAAAHEVTGRTLQLP
ncbi:hypothetical protein [Sinomonas sp. G460-2]|uniref:hypothetical protein n=1 Tax=Sinomonas sp. G460-2 TaxID=3393464 RepID=UPI0039EF8F2F